MVTIDSNNNVTTSTDFDNLQNQLSQVSPPNDPSEGSSSSSFPSCPAQNSTFLASTTLPPTPVDSACNCLASSVSCQFTPSGNPNAVVGSLLDEACGLLGQQGGNCDAISADGQTGTYGTVSSCDACMSLHPFYLVSDPCSDPLLFCVLVFSYETLLRLQSVLRSHQQGFDVLQLFWQRYHQYFQQPHCVERRQLLPFQCFWHLGPRCSFRKQWDLDGFWK